MEHQLPNVPSLPAQPIKMSSCMWQAPALFKALGPGLGAVLTWQGPCPPCPHVFFLHCFPASGPHEPADRQSLITTWLTVLLIWWASGGRVCPPCSPPTCCLQAAPAQHFLSFGSLTTVEAAAGSETQPHTSFHDIMSADGRDIKGPGTRFMCVGMSLFC